jgi:hypothetical protein
VAALATAVRAALRLLEMAAGGGEYVGDKP